MPVALAMCGSSSPSVSPADGGSDVTAVDSGVEATIESGASVDALADAPADLLALCDGIFGAPVRSLASCCSPADLDSGPASGLLGELGIGQSACDTNLTRSLSRGRIRIDDMQAAACESAIQATLTATPLCWPQATPNRNDDLLALLSPPACASPVVGLQATGAPCAFDYECTSGDACLGWTSTADGTCEPPAALAQACGGNLMTGTVTWWYPFGPHPQCVAGATCVDTCNAQAGDGGMCDLSADCLTGLVCANFLCGPTYPGAGSPCSDYMDCQEGTWCNQGDGGAGVCMTRQVAGTACNGSFNQCSGYCDAGTCVAICGSQ